MNKFEKILLRYGGYTLICVRNLLELSGRYEDCAEINKVLGKYDIDRNMDVEDWVAEFWKNGYSGEIALNNRISYFIDAMEMYEGERL